MFTVDTRKDHCPIRIAYAYDFTPGETLHWSRIKNEPGDMWSVESGHDAPIAIIELTVHSDYSGGDVEASNYRVLAEKFPWLIHLYGPHGTKGLAYDATLGPVPDSEELCEVLEGLESYPLIDDDDHSDLEMNLETEAWDDHGLQDFRKSLVTVLDTLDSGHEHELPDDDERYALGIVFDANVCSDPETWKAALWDLWRAGCDSLNVNGGSGFEVETGCIVYFYIDDWKAKAGCDSRYPTNRPIHDALRELAKATRIPDDDDGVEVVSVMGNDGKVVHAVETSGDQDEGK